jgi:phosphoribosylformylglycinamidine synthase
MITHKCHKGQILKMPIAHAEGRYISDMDGLARLRDQDQILFKYCTPEVALFSENGSTEDIAGICNEQRNVFGMMPHPERASEAILGNTDGLVLFQSLYSAVLEHSGN